jgi:hypothetical protein
LRVPCQCGRALCIPRTSALASAHFDLFSGRISSNITDVLPQVAIQGPGAKMISAALKVLGLMGRAMLHVSNNLGFGEASVHHSQKMSSNVAFEHNGHSVEYFFLFLWRWPEASKSHTTIAFDRTMPRALFVRMCSTQGLTTTITTATSIPTRAFCHWLLSHVPFWIFSNGVIALLYRVRKHGFCFV